jgi:hypothetical protein
MALLRHPYASPSTVKFGLNGATSNQNSIEDADGDGTPDLLLHFKTQDTGIKSGDTQTCLTGEKKRNGYTRLRSNYNVS